MGWDRKSSKFVREKQYIRFCLLPIGGYVRMAGHDEDEQEIKPGMMITIVLDSEKYCSKIEF